MRPPANLTPALLALLAVLTVIGQHAVAQDPQSADQKSSTTLKPFFGTTGPSALSALDPTSNVGAADAKRIQAEKDAMEARAKASAARVQRQVIQAPEMTPINKSANVKTDPNAEANAKFAASLNARNDQRIARNVHLWRVARLNRIIEIAKESGDAGMEKEARALLTQEQTRHKNAKKSGEQN